MESRTRYRGSREPYFRFDESYRGSREVLNRGRFRSRSKTVTRVKCGSVLLDETSKDLHGKDRNEDQEMCIVRVTDPVGSVWRKKRWTGRPGMSREFQS